jgi:hypothetical protein
MYDFKPTLLMIATFMMHSMDEILKTSILGLNLVYLSYQFYAFHKNRNDDNDK